MKKNTQINIRSKVSAIKWVLLFSLVIMAVKFLAWYYSGSEAILSDALESLINIATSLFTLYSLLYASKLKDNDHPYGHGKIEYLAVGFEGALIFGTGIYIIVNSIRHFFTPHELKDVDMGLLLTLFSAIAMWWIGRFLSKRGEELDAAPLKADGEHFKADALTSIGLILGLGLYKLTGWTWVDPLLAILLALLIMNSGIRLLRESIDRLLDKADLASIEQIVKSLQENREETWIDIHNLRLQKFGHYLHVDCHMTLPFYLQLNEVHDNIKKLENALNRNRVNHVELFVHTDPCLFSNCSICQVKTCTFRQSAFVRKLDWTTENLMLNKKHYLPGETYNDIHLNHP
ncbi:MAG: cation transporter [Bacteroidia bacterium]|nr:cation transporter [Bacteroidia bacterium]